jgi:hypothetical protein
LTATPVDLELHITTVRHEDGLALRYILNSPRGGDGYAFQKVGDQPIGTEATFREMLDQLYRQLKQLQMGYDVDSRHLNPRGVEDALTSLGRDLYQRLFPPSLKAEYRKFRESVNTLLLYSDDRWAIPWELVRPFEEGLNDDFLCARFQLTRWLPDSRRPAEAIVARRAAAVTGEAEADFGGEVVALRRAWADIPGLEDASLPQATFRQVKEVLERGGVGLFHFEGHGRYDGDQPVESGIRLKDQIFRARDLVGPAQLRQQRDRPMVFLNACQVGRQGWWLTGLAGWAASWVRGCGCGAFLGPHWAVPGRPAARFAEVLYRELQLGRTLGEAAQTARGEVRKEFPDPTWLAYGVYAHPNARLLLGDAAPPVAGQPTAGVPMEIRRSMMDFGLFIEEKTRDFVGRQWLFDRVDAFLSEHPRGYFLLTGDPGIGKSSLAAELVRRRGWVHHFNIRAEGTSRAEDFLSNFSAQLIAAYDLPHASLPPETTRNGNFLKGLLEEVVQQRPDEKIVLVVDALDEALGAHSGTNPLFLPLMLPPGVYLLVTSRRGTHLSTACELESLNIDQDGEGNLADIQVFVERSLERPGIRTYLEAQALTEVTFVEEMVHKSQGNFMYLHLVLPQIERGAYQGREFSTLPEGLINYYEDHWSRLKSRDQDRWYAVQVPVLEALTVVKEPISMDLIVDFSKVSDRRRIHGVLEDWDAVLYKAQVANPETGESQLRYRLYHDSFHDFIAAKEVIADEKVDLKAAHGRIADVLWRELYPDDPIEP